MPDVHGQNLAVTSLFVPNSPENGLNQAYQFDTLPLAVDSEKELQPGDLIFISGPLGVCVCVRERERERERVIE